jgi:uncharacterized protein HemX
VTITGDDVQPSDTETVATEPMTAPADAEAQLVAPPDATKSRRWPRVVAALLVLATLGGVGTWGFTEHQSARQWRSKQRATAEQLAASQHRVEHYTAVLLRTEKNLEASRQLGNQLAAEKRDLTAQRTALANVLGTVPATTSALDACTQAWNLVSQDALSVADELIYTYNVDFSTLDSAINTANSVCDYAETKASSLQSSISDLGL